MDDYDYGRDTDLVRSRDSPSVSRTSGRDRDDYRAADPYRDNRRRSPGESNFHCRIPDRRRDRRRSRSPTQIDRYQPDRVRDDYSYPRSRDEPHSRRRSSPPPIDRYVPGPEPAAVLVNPLPDPMKLDFQVGFTWFAEWWRTEQRIKEEKERAKTGRAPPRLRGERESREDREAERPKIQAAYDQYKENLQRSQAQTFVRLHKNEDWFRERYVPEVREPFRRKLVDYRKGLFAQWEHDLSNGVFDDFTLEGIYKSESNGLGGILEREEGETSAAAEVLGVGDLLPSKGGDLRDPASLQPTLLIKTIAPTVTRDKFESFAKEYLGEDEGGFKHLSLSDPNPLKKCHRMGWIILNPEAEQDPAAEERAAPREEGEDGEETEAKPEMPSGLASVSDKALEKINGKTIEDPERGNFTVHCGVHRPPEAPRKKALWDLFSSSDRIARDLELATRLVRRLDNELGDEYFGVAKIEERRKCPGGHLRRPRASLTSAAKETARASASGEPFPLRKKNDSKADGEEELEAEVKEDSPEEDKKSLMKPSTKTTQQLQRAYNWVRTFEEKILQILEPDSVNIRKLGGTPLEEGVDKELNKFVLQEDTNKFRCKVPECTKLFKGTEFWRKHVEKRHADFHQRVRSEVELVNTYVLDPAHIAPSRSDANSNGHFPLNNHQPTGTPRGFQLNQAYPMGFPGMPAGMATGGAPGMPAMFGHGQPMGMPGWAGAMAGGVGPMRNNNRSYMNNGGYRNPGPYARNGRGRMPSMTGGRPMGMMEGGAATMGPNEAVVGRSLRSYEDLDADKGEGTGELNY
ncbi:Zinc finger protein [Pseudocercospora fuligena]|uniref:Zinc finger protein n=1 Tax=Pseudocercospora fuligena TaxID=685502 RepID=A0A8H6RFS9_9PEZI|nr:Zinc finger protein [Pseudocercospora fuligena]